jgi:hypothetical protein
MVMRPATQEEIDQLFKYCILTSRSGSPAIIMNSETGAYTVHNADVALKKDHHMLPVKFDHVSHSFYAVNLRLTSLVGSPSHVGGAFVVNNNDLSSLQGAPDHVGSYMVISKNLKLKNLEHLPTHIQGILHMDYKYDMPLLRTLVAQGGVDFGKWAPEPVIQILNDERWVGKGKSHILQCANELKQAGFKENARW